MYKLGKAFSRTVAISLLASALFLNPKPNITRAKEIDHFFKRQIQTVHLHKDTNKNPSLDSLKADLIVFKENHQYIQNSKWLIDNMQTLDSLGYKRIFLERVPCDEDTRLELEAYEQTGTMSKKLEETLVNSALDFRIKDKKSNWSNSDSTEYIELIKTAHALGWEIVPLHYSGDEKIMGEYTGKRVYWKLIFEDWQDYYKKTDEFYSKKIAEDCSEGKDAKSVVLIGENHNLEPNL